MHLQAKDNLKVSWPQHWLNHVFKPMIAMDKDTDISNLYRITLFQKICPIIKRKFDLLLS